MLAALLALQADDIDRWIGKLGDAELAIRDEATQKLIGAGEAAVPRVRKQLESSDPEVRARARRILDARPPEFERLKDRDIESAERFAFAPDGSAVACFDKDRQLQVIDLAAGKVRFSIQTRRRTSDGRWERSAPCWTADGLLAETEEGAEGSLRKIDAATGAVGEVAVTWRGNRPAAAIRIIPTGDALVSAGGQLHVYFSKMAKSYFLPRASHGVMSDDGARIVGITGQGATSDVGVYVAYGSWKNMARAELKGWVDMIVATPNLGRITTGGRGGTFLAQIDAESLAETLRVELKAKLSSLAMRPDGKWLLVGTEDGKLGLYDPAKLAPVAEIDLLGEAPQFAASTEDGSVVGVLAGGKIRLYRRK